MIVTYTGKERCDILYFLIQIGKRMGKKILAVDNSYTHDLFLLFQKDDGEEIYQLDNLTICKDCKPDRKVRDYDIVFIYEGLLARYEGERDKIILAPSCEKAEMEMVISGFKGNIEIKEDSLDNVYIVARDQVNRKFTSRTIAKMYGLKAENCFDMSFDEKDYSMYISLTHNGYTNFMLSPQMYDLIESMAADLYGIDARTLKKIMK